MSYVISKQRFFVRLLPLVLAAYLFASITPCFAREEITSRTSSFSRSFSRFSHQHHRILLPTIVGSIGFACYKYPKQAVPLALGAAALYLSHLCLSDNFYTVEEGMLYRSTQLSSEVFAKYINKYGIKTVVNLRGKSPTDAWWVNETTTCQKLQVTHYDIPMSTLKFPAKENVQKLLAIYDTAPKPILIHCRAGADRTGEAAALWCMDKMGLDKEIALDQLLLRYRHQSLIFPAKRSFIEMWQGRDWLANDYHPETYPIW